MSKEAADDEARIESVLKTANHFDTLKLPYPTEDALGRPVWTLQKKDISKQYKKISLGVHPDKNRRSTKARDAFAKVTRAYEALLDPSEREVAYMMKLKRPHDWLPNHLEGASIEKIAEYHHRQKYAVVPYNQNLLQRQELPVYRQEADKLRKHELSQHEEAVKKQMHRKREESKRKREEAEAVKQRNEEARRLAAEAEEDSSGEESDSVILERLRKKRKKKKFF